MTEPSVWYRERIKRDNVSSSPRGLLLTYLPARAEGPSILRIVSEGLRRKEARVQMTVEVTAPQGESSEGGEFFDKLSCQRKSELFTAPGNENDCARRTREAREKKHAALTPAERAKNERRARIRKTTIRINETRE